MFLTRFFAHNNSNGVAQSFFTPCWHFFPFDPNWPFCKGYSLCVVAIFKMFSFFENLVFFGADFDTHHLRIGISIQTDWTSNVFLKVFHQDSTFVVFPFSIVRKHTTSDLILFVSFKLNQSVCVLVQAANQISGHASIDLNVKCICH